MNPKGMRRGRLIAVTFLLALSSGCGEKAVAPVVRDLNIHPVASFSVSSTCMLTPVTLDASASHDDDGSIRLYEWDFDNDGTIDASGAALVVVQHVYPAGNHRAKLVVTDDAGAYAVTAASFTVVPPDTTYVSSTTGSPAGPGTRASPYSTLTAAILANAGGACPRVILVATGYYPEAPDLRSNMIIRGGFNPVDWTHLPASRTDLDGSPSTASNVHDTEVSDLRFIANDMTNPGLSAIAFVASYCDASLRFVRCDFVARNAGPGRNGADNAGPGDSGEAGQLGSLGGRGGGAIVCCRSAPNAGGSGGSRNHPGEAGHSPCSAVGTAGAAGSSNVEDGGNGGAGGDGAAGANGSGTTSGGSFNGGVWVPSASASGQAGCDGGGGGGGGGGWTAGGCPTDWSGTGGGGGQGGVGGTAGWGGWGGGASIALVLVDASPRFEDCSFTSGRGGDGGLGGSGQDGAAGGAGAAGATSVCGTRGGDGGPGGASGPGGGGQGGAGGPSWCIVRQRTSTPVLVNSTLSLGTGGAGGLGGLQGGSGPRAASGPVGPAATYGP